MFNTKHNKALFLFSFCTLPLSAFAVEVVFKNTTEDPYQFIIDAQNNNIQSNDVQAPNHLNLPEIILPGQTRVLHINEDLRISLGNGNVIINQKNDAYYLKMTYSMITFSGGFGTKNTVDYYPDPVPKYAINVINYHGQKMLSFSSDFSHDPINNYGRIPIATGTECTPSIC